MSEWNFREVKQKEAQEWRRGQNEGTPYRVLLTYDDFLLNKCNSEFGKVIFELLLFSI